MSHNVQPSNCPILASHSEMTTVGHDSFPYGLSRNKFYLWLMLATEMQRNEDKENSEEDDGKEPIQTLVQKQNANLGKEGDHDVIFVKSVAKSCQQKVTSERDAEDAIFMEAEFQSPSVPKQHVKLECKVENAISMDTSFAVPKLPEEKCRKKWKEEMLKEKMASIKTFLCTFSKDNRSKRRHKHFEDLLKEAVPLLEDELEQNPNFCRVYAEVRVERLLSESLTSWLLERVLNPSVVDEQNIAWRSTISLLRLAILLCTHFNTLFRCIYVIDIAKVRYCRRQFKLKEANKEHAVLVIDKLAQLDALCAHRLGQLN